MTRNPDFLRCKEERNNEGFFKLLQSIDLTSENMRALPHDFGRRFSEKDLSRKMKIRAQWGSSWEVGISRNPRFYFMEKSGWEKFVRDNALGNNEFLTFTHKGKMHFTVNIFKQDGKEMIHPAQPAAFLASSSRIKTEQREDVNEDEVVVSSELSNRGPTTAAAASSSSISEFTIVIKKTYATNFLGIPVSFAKKHMPKDTTTVKVHHPNGEKSWDVLYLARETKRGGAIFSAGWALLSREYPLKDGDTCKLKLTKRDELILFVSKP